MGTEGTTAMKSNAFFCEAYMEGKCGLAEKQQGLGDDIHTVGWLESDNSLNSHASRDINRSRTILEKTKEGDLIQLLWEQEQQQGDTKSCANKRRLKTSFQAQVTMFHHQP